MGSDGGLGGLIVKGMDCALWSDLPVSFASLSSSLSCRAQMCAVIIEKIVVSEVVGRVCRVCVACIGECWSLPSCVLAKRGRN